MKLNYTKNQKSSVAIFEWYYRLSHNYFLNLTNKISLKMIGQRYDYNNEYVLVHILINKNV